MLELMKQAKDIKYPENSVVFKKLEKAMEEYNIIMQEYDIYAKKKNSETIKGNT